MRTNLLEKAFNKTINETLKNTKNKLKNTTEEEILNSLTDVFITHSTEAFTKLEELDILLSKEIINLRDIKSKEYINEILESYIFNDKISFVNKISELIKEKKIKRMN